MMQFLKLAVRSHRTSDEDIQRDDFVLVPLDLIGMICPQDGDESRTSIDLQNDANSYLIACHTFDEIAEALAVADSFGPVIDMIVFSADEAVRNENLAPAERRQASIEAAQRAAKRKFN